MTAAHLTEQHLLENLTSDGNLSSPCASRAIETALYVHLLRSGPGGDGGALRDAVAWCDRLAREPLSESTGTELDTDTALKASILQAAVGDHDAARAIALSGSLARFRHHSTVRKGVLFSVLFAELGIVPFSDLDYEESDFGFAHSHHWAALMMTAAKLVYARGKGDPDLVSAQDLARIEASQSPNGSWENHILLTLVILIGLADGQLPRTSERGLGFLARHRLPDGGMPFVPDIDVWLTAMTGYLFCRNGVQNPARALMANYIRNAQRPDGGWGFSAEVAQTDFDDTAMCLLFLASQGPDDDHALAARTLLLEGQNRDGGFSTYVREAPSEVEVTAHIVMALAAAGGQTGEIRQALDWLVGEQRPDGSFRHEWTVSDHYATSQVLWALSMLDGDTSAYRELESAAVEFILDSQRSDGGWGQFPGLASTALSTSYALIGLVGQSSTRADRAIRDGLAFLVRQQRADGSVHSPPDAVGPRPLVYDVERFAAVYAYWAMSAHRPPA